MKHYLLASLLVVSLPVTLHAQEDVYDDIPNDRKTYIRSEGASELKIRLSDNAPITVMLDRNKFTNSDRLIRFANIPPRRYRIRVFLDEPGGMKRRNLVYDGYLRLEPSVSYYVVVDHTTGSTQINTANLEGEYVTEKDVQNFDHYGSYDEPGVIITEREERGPGAVEQGAALTAEQMNAIGRRINSIHNGDEKLAVLQKELETTTYTAAQVKTMMGWLGSDDDKLSFVKWAYDNTVDTQNYWRIESGLAGDEAKKKFNRFLDSKQ